MHLLAKRHRVRTIATTIIFKQLAKAQEHVDSNGSFNDFTAGFKYGFQGILMANAEQHCIQLDCNASAFASIMKRCAKMEAVAESKIVHTHIIKAGLEQDNFIGNNLVTMYTKCGSLMDARQVFDKMSQRNVISWTALMTGYAQRGYSTEVLELFSRMEREGVMPDNFTFATVVKACASLAALDHGKQVMPALVGRMMHGCCFAKCQSRTL